MENQLELVLKIAQRLHQRNLLAAADGNISFRAENKTIWITPTAQTKAFMDATDLAQITIDNEILSGNPSSERLLHLSIYKKCPEAKAVVHAHPPNAIAWSLAFPKLAELPFDVLPEVVLATGKIPIVPYVRPGTREMGESLAPYLPDSKVLILQKHGAVSWGRDLEEAYRGIERLEHICLILKLALELKNLNSSLEKIPEDELEALLEMRKKIGNHNL